MKIDEAKKNLKSRLTDNSFLTKNSQEAINFIEGYMLLLENYNSSGEKLLRLSKQDKFLQNSPKIRAKPLSGISDSEKKDSKHSLQEKSEKRKLYNLGKSNHSNQSGEFSPNRQHSPLNLLPCKKVLYFNDENSHLSSFSNCKSNENEESPSRISSKSPLTIKKKPSFVESRDSSSLNLAEKECKSSTVKNKDSSDDEKSSDKSSNGSGGSCSSGKSKTEKKCYSDGASNMRSHADFLEEKNASDIGIQDFDFIKLINKGAFGRVWLVKRKKTGDLYAMKIVNCLDNMNKNQLDSLKAESEVFDRITNEFVVKSYFRFTHETFICFVMEYMYGDFSQVLKSYGCFDEEIARFYIAELILAVEHLHSLKIIHRDLKPDNILLDAKGHIKLTDFGLSDTCMKMYKNTKRKTFIGEENMDDFISRLDLNMIQSTISFGYCKEKIKGKISLEGKSEEILVNFLKNQEKNTEFEANSAKKNAFFPNSSKDEIFFNNISENTSILPDEIDESHLSPFHNNSPMNNSPLTDKSHRPVNSRSVKNLLNNSPVNNLLNKTSNNQKKSIKKIVGTPDYMAPEILSSFEENILLGPSIDWWSIGVILFEFLTGIPPFNDDTIDKIFDNITAHKIPWDCLEIGYQEQQMSPEAFDLITRLLNANPKERLGSKGVEDIKKHEFFKDFKWSDIRNQIPPIVPEMKSLEAIPANAGKRFEDNEFREPFIVRKDLLNELKLQEVKKLIVKNMNTFTQTRYDLLAHENLLSIKKAKSKNSYEIVH